MMKWMYMIITCVLFAACQDDDGPCRQIDDNIEEEELVAVQFGVSVGVYSTYSSIIEDPKTSLETGDIKDADIYIFRQNGLFYKHEYITLDDTGTLYTSDSPIDLPKGSWYIYAIIHKPTDFIVEPGEGTTIDEFEKQKVHIGTYDDWYTRYRTLMATPVREIKTITGQGNPEIITLKVGHLFSKVTVNCPDFDTVSNLKGYFRNMTAGSPYVSFNIACEPTHMHLIGQWQGEYLGDNSQVITPHYYNYDLITHFRDPLYYEPSNGTGFWFAVENANLKPNNENTSSFIVKFVYVPHESEVHGADHMPGVSLTGTFYIGEFADGTRLIYSVNPKTLVEHPVLGEVKNVKIHTNGECFYRIPIGDYSKATYTQKHAVIRNHHYVLTINSINGFGNDVVNDWGDWEIPWEEESDLEATLHVVPWEPYDIEVDLD